MTAKTNPLISYYGDDLTGSTDVMEALASNGVDTVLFMDVPDDALKQRFDHCRAIGLAGTSRSETPDWMDGHLTPAFQWLKSLEADICHYKVCSTFDSSPQVGNIGKAIEIGKAMFGQPYVPVLVGAPQLKRYTAFGHLFAAYQGEVYRIDRHPVMSRHPVTPMAEADLRLHLCAQTALKTGLADLSMLAAADADERVETLCRDFHGMVLFDVDSPESQSHAGRQLLRLRREGGWFVTGSSGVEYALLTAWDKAGLTQGRKTFPLARQGRPYRRRFRQRLPHHRTADPPRHAKRVYRHQSRSSGTARRKTAMPRSNGRLPAASTASRAAKASFSTRR